MPNPICPELKKELNDIKTLKQEFDFELENALNSKDTKKAQELRKELEAKIESIQNKLWPFETLEKKKIEEQYNEQKEVMEKNGIIEKLSNGEMGIRGIDPEDINKEKEYVFPKLEDILKKMKEKKEILEIKAEQGFNQLLIVPFGMKLDDLIEKYKQILWKHYKEKKLFATMKNSKEQPKFPDDLPFEQDKIDKIKSGEIKYENIWDDKNKAVYVWQDEYKNAEAENKIVYYPEKFDPDPEIHKGKTKQEILKKQEEENPATAGFEIFLVEDLPNIPREGQGKEVGKGENKRKQLETNEKPRDYLEKIKNNPQYKNEKGQTPETQIIYAIQYLEKHNQVIDDYEGNGSASYQIGVYFAVSGDVPSACWYRGYLQARLGRGVPGLSDSDGGVRSVAMVF